MKAPKLHSSALHAGIAPTDWAKHAKSRCSRGLSVTSGRDRWGAGCGAPRARRPQSRRCRAAAARSVSVPARPPPPPSAGTACARPAAISGTCLRKQASSCLRCAHMAPHRRAEAAMSAKVMLGICQLTKLATSCASTTPLLHCLPRLHARRDSTTPPKAHRPPHRCLSTTLTRMCGASQLGARGAACFSLGAASLPPGQ